MPDPVVRNPFVGLGVASRYASARPALHGEAIAAFQKKIARPRRALDLGCGTGLSTRALVGWAQTVVGTDVSEDMLAHAGLATDATFVLGRAERLPFRKGVFDLLTVASAIHWFDRSALAEVRRVLTDRGALGIYDVWFRAEMVGEKRFSSWMSDVCGPRYPAVPKNEGPDLPAAGFTSLWADSLHRNVPMTLQALTDYLMTHSERIAAVRDGRESESDQRRFLTEGLRPIYEGARHRSLGFGITVELFAVV